MPFGLETYRGGRAGLAAVHLDLLTKGGGSLSRIECWGPNSKGKAV